MAKAVRVSAGNKRRVQVRKERKDGFSAARKQIFLSHFASGCNVTRAAKAAGVSVNTVNHHRRADPGFGQQCREALQIGYENLEAQAIEWGTGSGQAPPGGDAATADEAPPPEPPDKAVAMHLLQLRDKPLGQRTGRAGAEPRRVTEKELNESLLAKLDVYSRRLKLKRHEVRKLKSRKAVATVAAERTAGAGASGTGKTKRRTR